MQAPARAAGWRNIAFTLRMAGRSLADSGTLAMRTEIGTALPLAQQAHQ